ncbi:beta-propeller fold lactonase family protein [Candidatus Babeliales bacterium]|nr:beta-propeller fold lactonase family protein [Candidatus Babeliales bacterium]
MKQLSFQFYLLITLINLSVFMNADITIDGNGNTLELSSSGILKVGAGKTLTLKNLTLKKLSAERIIMINGTSKLKLDNARIILDDAYSFSQGSIEILNNSVIEGEFTFTFSGHNLFIDKNSTLEIGKNTTFVCTPTGGIINPIYFEDETSSLFLNNATFKNHNLDNQGNYLGLIFTNGNFVVDGTSYLENAGTTTDQGVMLGVGPTSYGDCKLEIKPNAKLIIQNAALIYNNSGTKSLNMSGNSGNIETQNDANFVLATNSISLASFNFLSSSAINMTGINTLNINNKTLNIEAPTISGQTGIGNLASISLLDSENYTAGGAIFSLSVSPDGGYIAVGGNSPTNGNELQVYQFDGASLTLLTNAQADYGTQIRSIEWSPDGKYIAIGGLLPTNDNEVQVYQFDGASLTLLTNAQVDYAIGSNTVYSVDWSPDGRYLAIGGTGAASSYDVQVYQFNGSSLTLTNTQADYGTGGPRTINWSPDGKYIAAGGTGATDSLEVQVYQFDESSLTVLTNAQVDYGSNAYSVNWSPDSKYLAVGGFGPTNGNEIQIYEFDGASLTLLTNAQANYGSEIHSVNWSADGKYLAAGGSGPTNDNEIQIYEFDGTSLTLLTNAQANYGNVTHSVNWFPNGKYLAAGGFVPSNNNELQVFSISFDANSSKLSSNNGTISLQQSTKLETINLSIN